MLPLRSDPRWIALVEQPDVHGCHFLALKILMQRVALRARHGMTTDERDAVIDEVCGFFEKNQSLLSHDIATLFGDSVTAEGKR
jgi:hypothetical protein